MKKILYITGCIVMAFAMMIIGTSEAKAVTATASSEYNADYGASKAIDVNPDTRWSANTAGDAWIQLNYDTPQMIQGLQVYPLSWTFNTVDVEYVNGLGELEAVANLVVNGDSPMRISFCPVETKAIRLNLINNTGNNPSLSEMGVVFIEIAASSEYPNPNYAATKAVDGNLGTRWSAYSLGDDSWIQLNYETAQVIEGLWFYTEGPHTINTVSVEYVNENCGLESVTNLAVDITSGGYVWTISFCPVVTKSIRLNIPNTGANAPIDATINEMAVLFQEPIEASSEYSGAFSADKAIDGVIGFENRWSASGSGDAWVQLNYDNPMAIEGLEVYPVGALGTIDVEYLNENCELEAVTNLVVNGSWPMVITFCPVETKSIRLNMTDNPGTPSIFEMAVLLQTGIPADCDGDSIPDACEESDIDVLCAQLGAIIDAQVPPTDSYNNHGQYVSRVAHAADLLVDAECHLSTDDAEDLHSCLVSTRAKSDIGKRIK